jgi:hypothetical protein
MTSKKCFRLLAELEELKRRFGIAPRQLEQKLRAINACEIDNPESLIRFHETLLFLRAYPPTTRVLEQVEKILKSFGQRVSQLRESGADPAPLDEVEVSGIVGSIVTSNFSHQLVRWLVSKYPGQVSIDWDWFEEDDRFGATMPRFLPLLEEDAMVEAHVPYRAWLRAAKGRRNDLVWIIERFESLKISNQAKAELYDSLKLHVNWKFGVRASRTGMKLPTRKIFFHPAPLIQRREVSLVKELGSPPIPIKRLSRAAGEKILDLARETSAVRYRELHGFTCGDSRRMLKATLGRGTEAFVLGVPPENRLPLRAYHAALVLKNGVPVAYFEGLSIFERLESGFNLYYTFREGETAWLFGRILCLMRQLLGVSVFSIDPYQVGHENEEGIESGAFWFYRKLGFRPVRTDLMKLALAEEQKITGSLGYRTPARTLRKLAAGHMLFELPGASAGDWDRFQIRNVGLAVQKRMADDFGGDAQKIRADSANFIKRVVGLDTRRWREPELRIFESFALVLAMIPGIARWNANEKQLAARIIVAKARDDEGLYLRLMQTHARMRAALIGFGL